MRVVVVMMAITTLLPTLFIQQKKVSNMSSCITADICDSAIVRDIIGNCDNPLVSGVEPVALIINKADIESVGRNPENRREVVAITLKDGKHAFRFVQQKNNPLSGSHTDMVVGDYGNTFTRTINGFIPMDGAFASQQVLDPLKDGRFVVIFENTYVSDDDVNRFQIFGLDRGLATTSLVQTKYENNDYWLWEAAEEGVANSGIFFHSTLNTEVTSQVSASIDTDTGKVSIEYDSDVVNYHGASLTDVAYDSSTSTLTANFRLIFNTGDVLVGSLEVSSASSEEDIFVAAGIIYLSTDIASTASMTFTSAILQTDDSCEKLQELLVNA